MLPSLLPCHTDDGTMATSPHSSDDSTPHSSQFSTHSSESPLPPRSRKPPTHTPTSVPSREDCWSEDATFTLIDAWGERYLDLKRGNLRQNDWQQVAAAVNSRHAHTRKLRRTDVQCKNRMDTVKKKYKIEKARVSESSGDYVAPWPFFVRLDSLIGVTVKPSPPAVGTRRQTSELPPPPSSVPKSALPPPPYSVPVRPRSKRPAPAPIPVPAPAIPSATRRLRTRVPPRTPESPQVDDAISRRKFLAMAEAAAAVAEAEEQSDNSVRSCREGGAGEGYGRLAEAVERFGEIYERVEGEKQRVLIELEKGRMQFAKDLEIQRMKLIMESQLRLERMMCSKRLRRSPH